MLSISRLQVKYMLSLSSSVFQILKGWGKNSKREERNKEQGFSEFAHTRNPERPEERCRAAPTLVQSTREQATTGGPPLPEVRTAGRAPEGTPTRCARGPPAEAAGLPTSSWPSPRQGEQGRGRTGGWGQKWRKQIQRPLSAAWPAHHLPPDH